MTSVIDDFDTQISCEEYNETYPESPEFWAWVDRAESEWINMVNIEAAEAAETEKELA